MSYLKRTAFVVTFVLGGAAASAGPLSGQTRLDPDPAVRTLASAETQGMRATRVDYLAESFDRTMTGPSEPIRLEARLETGADVALPPIAARSILLRPSSDLILGASADELPMFERRQDRRGVPWIIAGSALIVGGAIVGDDIGTLLMAGGVGVTAYGLFIYF